MDAIHFLIEKYIDETDKHEELWSIVKSIVWVVEPIGNKQIKVFGNLERGPSFYLFKLLCWVAVDRAIKISEIIQSGKSAKKWEGLRTEIYNDIIENAWNDEVQSFTQSCGLSSFGRLCTADGVLRFY